MAQRFISSTVHPAMGRSFRAAGLAQRRSRRPPAAPPHDATGHTWHHGDDILFRITRDRTAAVVGAGYESDMPGFGDSLRHAEIRAILDYITSTWPERERAYQRERTMQERAEKVDGKGTYPR